MGALCCAHNREPIASNSTDEEQEALTAVDDDSRANEPELEYPDKQSKLNNAADDDIKQDSNNAYICDSTKNCQCILNIEQIIKYYISWIAQHNNPSKKNNISIINRIKDNDKNNYKKTMYCYIHKTFSQIYHQYNYSNISLINDFNHILFKHNNEMDIVLDNININKLFHSETNHFITNRNNRDPSQLDEWIKMYFGSQEIQEIQEIHTQQLCDKIYCFLFNNINNENAHTSNEKNQEEKKEEKEEMNALINSHHNTEDDADEYIYINKELLEIQNKYKNIKNNFVKMRGFDRINNKNRFFTNIENNNNSFSDIFAFKYYYWSYYQSKQNAETDWFINQTYLTLKEEILSHSIDLIQFNLFLKTATNYMHSNHCKYAMICNTDEWEIKYEIRKGDGITVSHLIAILLYCNHDSFTTQLLKTYHKINMEETHNSLNLRHAKFYFVGKYLTELVDCFTTVQEDNIGMEYYYHVINENVIFSDKTTPIKCPFSVTSKYSIAYMNTNSDNGLILQLHPNDNYNIKYFDCKWITDFVAEDEKLFNGWHTFILLNTIISIKNGLCNDYKIYLNALYIIKGIMDGKLYTNNDKLNRDKTLQTVVQRLIRNKIYTVYTDWETLPMYIEKLTNYYFSTLKKVNINYNSIKQNEENGGYKFLEKLLLQSNDDDDDDDDDGDSNNLSFINVDIFKSLFPDLKEIIINFSDCNKDEYCVNCKLFEYILLHLKSLNKWNGISILFNAKNYREQTLSNTINLYKDQFESFNWKLKRVSYQNTITILNNKPAIAFVS